MRMFFKAFLLTLCCVQIVHAGKEIAFSVLSLDQATKEIIEANQNKVLSAKTEKVDGKDVHVIKVLTQDGRIQSLKVDAESGKLIK